MNEAQSKDISQIIIENQVKILYLFRMYQMVELLLFLNLYLPETNKTEDKDKTLENINYSLLRKTFGSILKKYKESFPNDEHGLYEKIKNVKDQRNDFMHISIVLLNFISNEDRSEKFISLLADYENNLNILFDNLTSIKDWKLN